MGDDARRYDIDWLRVLGMFSVFFFHCARFFDRDPWHVKNDQLSFGLSVFVVVLVQWIMPLFFVTSGISSYLALSHRTKGQYVYERFKRLFIPLVFGIFVLIPPQVYIERVTRSQFVGSFFDFFPHYFDGLYAFGGNFAWMGLHLWYLEVLFIFSLLTLPLLWALKKKGAGRFKSGLAGVCALPAGVFLMAVPLAIAEVLVNMQPHGIGARDFGGWSPVLYLILLIYGYFMASDERIRSAVERWRTTALALAVATTVLGFALIRLRYSSYSPLFSILRACNSWFWLVAIVGFAGRFLRFNSRFLPRANEAVLPFYILHQTVIVIIGYSIASWHAGVAAKYLLLSTSSFAVIMLVYELAVRRIGALRLLFGMKQRSRLPLVASARGTAQV